MRPVLVPFIMNRNIHSRKTRVAVKDAPLPFIANVGITGSLIGLLIVMLSLMS
jgi:hypothetical protein